ncbi:MAG: potassium transporter Kup [Alphaproteobacteria bacterium]|nr:potassium transporter Kup [Alphaproteobacteria bacterium]
MEPTTPSFETEQHHGEMDSAMTWRLTIGAVGVVYGDIGTSPIYALRESLHAAVPAGQLPATADVLGILSLILWSLTIIVSIKYVSILLRVDNHGEGGILALMALARSILYRNTTIFLFLGMMGAALFFGDGIITPALSVLSSIEGLEVVTPAFDPYIIPITLGIILGLFLFQSRGTDKVSSLFGPVTVIWFLMLACTGLSHIADAPQVLAAINPWHAVIFLVHHGSASFIVLGSIFLAVTGSEALYADLGHFGRKPIQLAWAWFVFPALALNYLGQGALVLHDPSTLDNPFFKMVSKSWLLPLVGITTMATIIASQAVITGAYSLTRQAINLGILPRMKILHTSDIHSGQIYLPQVNYMLMIGVIIFVLLFKSSSNMAAAYGISVTGTMVLTAIMTFFIIWQIWEWPLWAAAVLVGPFFVIDCVFLGANMLKVFEGGWVPLGMAAVMMLIMLTWIQGTFIINGRARKRDIRLDKFIAAYKERYPDLKRISGTAFFFSNDISRTPAALTQNIRHNKVLHEKNIILSVKSEPIPYVDPEYRAVITHLNEDFSVILLRFGFQETPNVQEEILRLNGKKDSGIYFDWADSSLFLSRRSLRAHPKYGLPLWQDFIYIWLSKHAAEPTDFYQLPVSRVIEVGRHIMI